VAILHFYPNTTHYVCEKLIMEDIIVGMDLCHYKQNSPMLKDEDCSISNELDVNDEELDTYDEISDDSLKIVVEYCELVCNIML